MRCAKRLARGMILGAVRARFGGSVVRVFRCYNRVKVLKKLRKMSKYPDNFPTSDCPLASATPCNGEVFHACQTGTPAASDFLTYEELGWRIGAKGDAACKRFGLSVFPKKSDCEHAMQLIPSIGVYVAAAVLTPAHGEIADTKSSLPNHQTWWPFDDVDRASLFS